MNFRYPMLAKLLLALSVFAAVVPCQRGEGEEGGKMSPERMRELRQAMAEKGLAEEEMEKILRVEEAANAGELPNAMLRGMRRGCAKYCTFAATIKPKQLLPGQSGVMMVSALLKDETVMESPAPIEVANVIGAPPVALGELTAHPAAPGALAAAYVGRPVYDNTAIFEIPVTMNADAKIGDKHTVSFDVRFDLHDGRTAQPVGRFIERISAIVEVGQALDPVVERVAGRSRVAQPKREEVPSVEAGGAAARQVAPAAQNDAIRGAEPAPMPSIPDERPSTVPEVEPPMPKADADAAGLPVPLLLGGGGLLLVIVVLLLARKK